MNMIFDKKRRHIYLLIGLFLVSAVLVSYWPIHNSGFVNYDDTVYVTKNRHVQAGLIWKGFAWAFTVSESDNWHPMTWLSHMLDCELYGLNPRGHHRTSLLFHMANSLLLFLVFKQMTGAVWRSAFVAALFALHPLNVESVAWISERKNVLSTFFGFLSVFAYIRYVRRKQLVSYLLCLLFLCLGLMAKPMLVTLPFVLLLLDFWPLDRFYGEDNIQSRPEEINGIKKQRALHLLLEKLPLFVPVLFSCIATFLDEQRIGGVRSLEQFSFPVRIDNALVAYVKYIVKAVWPLHLSVFYPHPRDTLAMWQVLGAALLIVGLSVLAVHALRRYSYITVGWFWFLGTLVPVIGLVQIGEQAMADRYTYIPLIGLFTIIAWGIPDLKEIHQYRRWGVATGLILLLFFLSARTYVQVGFWKDSVSLFENAVRVTTGNWLAHNNLGLALYKQGKVDEAISHYKKCLEIFPENDKASRNIADALVKKGKLGKAEKYYKQTLRINSEHAVVNYNLGIILLRQNRLQEAYLCFAEAIRTDPNYAEAYDYLGLILAHRGEIQKAGIFFSRAIQINPDFTKAQKHLEENHTKLSNNRMVDDR